jgi:AcrR family transcriptional regulator
MTPSRARGRPRSEKHRDAVLAAAMELMQEDDLRRASIDRISARSGVSKAMIYKWWPNTQSSTAYDITLSTARKARAMSKVFPYGDGDAGGSGCGAPVR